MWIFLQVAQRVLAGEKIGDVDAFEKLFGFIWDVAAKDLKGNDRETCAAVWEEYRIFSNPALKASVKAINDDAEGLFGTTADDGSYTPSKLKMEAKQLAPYEEYLANHGLLWPCREINGKWLGTSWRFNGGGSQAAGYDAEGVRMYGATGKAGGLSFYKTAGTRPAVCYRPYEPPALTPDDEYPYWFVTGRLLEHWHTGSNTTRIPELDNAVPEALLYMNADDASKAQIANGDTVKVSSQYGSFTIKATTDKRFDPPAGRVFAPFFDQRALINLAVEDVYCPLSKEPDYKKTPVKVEKA
jgi:nitrate reductase NapA